MTADLQQSQAQQSQAQQPEVYRPEVQQPEVSHRVISRISTYCEQNEQVVVVNTGTTLAQLELDSLALMEIVYDLEEELGITLEPSALPSLNSVGDLVAAINRARQSAA